MARRQLLTAAALLLALVSAAPAAASEQLPKRTARAEALRFITPFVDMLDVDHTVTADMVPARKCQRVTRSTVRCRFTATINTGQVIRSHVTVHRQRDGLLGFRTTLDVLADGI